MADMMQFDLVSPERRLASVQASSVQIPGADGDMTAMPDHAPTITTLRPGVLTVESAEGRLQFAVTGGFADVSGPATTILAEQAMPLSEVTDEIMAELVAEAEAKRDAASDTSADAAAKLVADMTALRDQVSAS
ncbi:F0F1 ATP synthase subunit epsilon [Rhodophyticola porphyridii]|uniref:ATP synthase epsilon chain n=1 Tax=Rhodophyticola porphyridii TaxID=1852017 RepID=A0A3L9YN01_9RHOB|nr:F0F1 ATP synthase subunit epsilon [Rhodophyticola porphyridii]RMA44080.1 F0F1 ATP synthase subunit epsilon [Rhodophyticola porphyridii]